MAPSKTLNLQLRGNVVDLVQHHNWLLIAAHHSEGQNLGIQIAPIHNLTSRVSTNRWILETPKSIQRFLSLPNGPIKEEVFKVDGKELDIGVLHAGLQKSEKIRSALKEKVRRTQTELGSLSDEQKIAIVKIELNIGQTDSLTETGQQTLAHILSIVEDRDVCRELQRSLNHSHEEATFGTLRQQGQRIVCVDINGQGYHVPYIPAEQDFDGGLEGLSLKPFSITDQIEFIDAVASNLVVLVVRRKDSSQWVCLYNLDSDEVVFEMTAPQPQEPQEPQEFQEPQEPVSVAEDEDGEDGDDGSEVKVQFETQVEDFERVITALATDVSTGRFALGFDDRLYLWFDPVKSDTDDFAFQRQELRDTAKEVMTSAQMKEQVNHTGAIIGLAFSNDFQSDKPFLTAFCDDLTTSRIQLRENIPSQKAKASSNAHSKRVRQVVKGPGHHFYTLSKDNTLRMWQTSNDVSSSIELRAECVGTVSVPVQDRHGKWSYNHFLVSGHDGEKVSGHNKLDSAVVCFRPIEVSNMDPTDRTGKVGSSIKRSYYGVWSYALQEMNAEPKDRQTLLEYIGTLNDQLSVDLLVNFVQNEENPEFVARALELLNETKHPRLIILFTELMSVDRASTCLQVLEYLRMDHVYGSKSLYPLSLANQSSFLEVRQAALRGFAGLASHRGNGSAEDNTTYQMAFERILGLFNDDHEEDIVANAFELLFAQTEPLMPGVEGVLLALAHSEFWVQRRALMLIYLKGMIDGADTTNTAQDLLRQMRESSNEDLRVLAFRLSLFAVDGVQQYLRSLDEVLHNQMNDLETERSLFLYGESNNTFSIDSTIERLFLDTVPEEDRTEKEVDMDEARSIVSDLAPVLVASKKSSPVLWTTQLGTFSYCIQTFPMTESVKEFLLASRVDLEFPAATFTRDLTKDEKVLLQEMALSYQPSIASLGAMALAKQGENSALPILLQLVDDKDDLVRSRSVDGLLEFINEPIVEHKLRLMVLQAENEQVKRNSRDKANGIRDLVRQSSLSITQRVVTQIVNLIFEDDVYSHSERLAVRYLFESAEVSFTSDSRRTLFKQIREYGERPKLINIRAKILRALYSKASSASDVAVQHLIAQTLDSPFDDVRMLAVVRLQKRIDDLIEAADDWTAWPRFTADTWSEYVKQHGGGLISATDVENLTVQSPVNPLIPLIGVPEPLLTEVQLLNRVLFWRGHEALSEWIKTYCKHNLIDADFISTRRFLLTLPIEEVFTHLLDEVDRNVQDTMIRADETATRWHDEMWMDYLNHPEEPKRKRSTQFYKVIDITMRSPRTSEEQESVSKGKVIPPYVPFVKAVFSSVHPSLKLTGFKQMVQFFAEEWVCEYIWQALESTDIALRQEAMSKRALWILQTHDLLGDALLHMLQSKHQDLFLRALDVLFHSTDEDIQKWTSGMIDGRVIDVLLTRIKEVWSDNSWVDANFVHRHFVNKDIFVKIPKPSLFGQNFEKTYFDLLRRIFVYETLEDIEEELTAYEALKDELIKLRNEGVRIQNLLNTDAYEYDPTDEKASGKVLEVFISTVMKRYATTPEKLGVFFKDQDTPELNLNQALSLVRSDLSATKLLQKPSPTQDKRFFDALTLLTVAKGSWTDELLKELMSTFDETLSNEAFNVYFTRGVQGGSADAFLSSMIIDNHPRLDDVFGMLLSQRYGSFKQLKNVLGACTRLNRIDIVFQAFTTLSNAGLIEGDSWDVLLESRHQYLRYRALNYFMTHKDKTERTKQIKRHYTEFIMERSPSSRSSMISMKDIEVALGQNAGCEELHAFVKNAYSLKFHQLEALRKRFPMSPGFIRKVVSSDTHLLVSGLTYEAAADLHDACNKLGITLVFSQTNPLYADDTQRLWRSNMEICLRYLRDNHWTTNERLAAIVLELDTHLAQHLNCDNALRTLALETLGSIAGPKNFEQMYVYLNGDYKETVSNSLVRSGNIQGLRLIFANNNRALVAMMTLGKEANLFVERTIQGALGAEYQHKAIQMWLLQLAQEGGKADLMMTMLSTSSHDHMLLASQLFGSMYAQATFEQRVVELLKLEKIELTPVPSEVGFHAVSRWQNAMKLMREAYVKHYCVEPASSKPVVLADLHAATTALNTAEQDLKAADKAYIADSGKDTDKSKKLKSTLQKSKDAIQKARDKRKKVNAELAKRYVTLEEWKWFARRMSSSNSRVRYLTAEVVTTLLDGGYNRKKMLESQEQIEKICMANDVTLSGFTPLSLNGMELTTESAVSFGFGSLAGIVRNHRNVTVGLRRKALASLIQLAEKHSVPTVSAALSVAFNDPSKQIRRDAFVIALNHQEALGLSWEQIIRQASNAVSLRNAENSASGSSNVDILNQLIVSELNRADRQDLLLAMIRTQPHNLGYTALELLLNVKTTEQDTVIAALTAALQSPNRNIRNQLVNRITSELQEVLQYNQQLLEEKHNLDYLSDEPYWDLLVQALDHGLTSIADAAADYLVEQAKRTEVTLEYVYSQWLNAFETAKQRRACQALERLRPHHATDKLLQRVYVNNLTETADLSTIQRTLTSLNQYAPGICDELFEAIDATRSTKRFSNDPQDPAFKLAYQLLVRYSGVSGSDSIPRVEIVCDIIKVLRKNSHYELLGALLTQFARHPVDRYLSAELDTQLTELATNLTHVKLVQYRKQALKICITRYLEMTPHLKDLPVSEHQKEPTLVSKWSTSGWSDLKAALVTNMEFQETKSKDKDFLSEFQKMSAMALIATQGYAYDVFKMVRKILENKDNRVGERSKALEALVVTESIHLLGPLQRLLGMESNGNRSEKDLLTYGGVETALYDRALALIGHYHYTEKKEDIFNYLLERWENTANHREPAVLTSLWRFKEYAEHQQALLDVLIAHQPHSSARKVHVDLPNTREDYTSFHLWYDMVMELYVAEFGETIAPLRMEVVQKTQRLILQEIERVDVNRIYQFYLTYCKTDRLDLDIQLWKSRIHMFLTADNRQILKERLVKRGNKALWMELMLEGIGSAAAQRKQQHIRDAMMESIGNRQRRLQDTPGQEPLLTVSDIAPLQETISGRFNLPQVEVLFAELFAQREELSVEVRKWIVELYHQNELGAWFVFTESQFDVMIPLNWQQEVDAWEVVISQEVSGVEFYIDLLNQYIDSDSMIFESVMDIVKKREFSEAEEGILLGVVTAVRMEWSVLQREKTKGVPNQKEIEQVEKRWNKILEFLDSLASTGEELIEILTLDATPLFLKRTALAMYLNREPHLEILASLYAEYPSFKPILAPYMNLERLHNVLMNSVLELGEYKISLEQWTQRLDQVLKDRTDFLDFNWLVNHSLALEGVESTKLNAFVEAVKSSDRDTVQKLLSIKSNRASIRQAAMYSVIAETIQAETSLSLMYWVTVEKGERLHTVIQHLIDQNALDPKKLDTALVLALSGAESSKVREAYTGLVWIFNKHREWNDLIDQSRGQRYTKELS